MFEERQAFRTGCIVAGNLVILDCVASRYFLVSDPGVQSTLQEQRLDGTVLLVWEGDPPLRFDTASQRRVMLAKTDFETPSGRYRMRLLATFRFLEWRYATLLSDGGLNAGLAKLKNTTCDRDSWPCQATIIAGAHHSKRLWSSRDRCLPRSLALAHLLRAAGSTASLVLGVALHPFAAHAWVQDGDIVLNDAVDHVRLFTPILVA